MDREKDLHHGWLEEAFETALFGCRFLVLIPVLGILAASVVMFIKGCVEVVPRIARVSGRRELSANAA